MVLAYASAPPSCQPAPRMIRHLAWLAAAGGLVAAPGPARAAEPVALPVTLEGMTYVASRGATSEVEVEAAHARFDPATSRAQLDQVHARVSGHDDDPGFALTCDHGEIRLPSDDLLATGNVSGTMAEGRRFRTDWVRYDSKRGLAYTEAPVEITDDSGTYRGVGFRYLVREKRFRLLGGASVEQRR